LPTRFAGCAGSSIATTLELRRPLNRAALNRAALNRAALKVLL
jgi:hypothetical protein